MKTRLTIDINKDDVDKELEQYLMTKLRHIAQGEVETLVDKKFETVTGEALEERMKDVIKKRSSSISNWDIETRVKKAVEEEVRRYLLDYTIGEKKNTAAKLVDAAVKEYLESINFTDVIDKEINTLIRGAAVDIVKEKVKKALDSI